MASVAHFVEYNLRTQITFVTITYTIIVKTRKHYIHSLTLSTIHLITLIFRMSDL